MIINTEKNITTGDITKEIIDLSNLTYTKKVNDETTEKRALTNDEVRRYSQKEESLDEKLESIENKMRAEAKARIDKIAEIIEKAQGQKRAEDKGKIADDIRNANK